ncbi:MAG: hypothetical protein HYV96_19620 [Opitutae bacterium]|nr:hypothetical protein [Opitutae bacterium]
MFARFILVLAAVSALAAPLQATSVKPPTFAELVNGADYIVRARVKRLVYEAKERPGKPPLIYTKVTLEVLETIAGEPPAEPVLTCLGGRVGATELRVEGAPRFKEGDEDILFVQGNGRNFFPLYAVMHGRYRVRHDDAGHEYIARSNDVPMSDVAEVAAPMTEGNAATLQKKFKSKTDALTPQSFVTKIREARRAK